MGKGIKITYWIFTILFAAFMLFSGISELMQTASANELLISLGYPVYLNIILGIAKVLGVVAIVQTKWRTIKEWAYAGFTIDMVGACFSFVLNGNGFLSILGILPFLLVMFISYTLWKKL
jgi:hypothetical protein